MGIHGGIPVAREMLDTGQDTGFPDPFHICPAEEADLLRNPGEAAVAHGSVFRLAQAVKNRSEIHIDPRSPQPFSDDPADHSCVFRLSGCAQGPGAWGIPGQMTDAGYFSSFLVDHDERGQAGFRKDQLPQFRAKMPQLMKVSDIPAEQKDISDLVFPDQIPDLRGDFSTRETGADPLPDGNGQVFLCDIHCNTSYHQS
jgi:hypothetical protein